MRQLLKDRFAAFDQPATWMDVETGTLFDSEHEALAAVQAGNTDGRDIIVGAREVLMRVRDAMWEMRDAKGHA